MKYRENWCPKCKDYLPPKGASSHKCLSPKLRWGEVLYGESKIKCCRFRDRTKKEGE